MEVASVETDAALADGSLLDDLALCGVGRRHCGAGVVLVTTAAAATEDDKGAQYEGGMAKALANEMKHPATNPSTGSCRLLNWRGVGEASDGEIGWGG